MTDGIRRIVFLDVETTGLDPRHHEMWEVALISREVGDRGVPDLEEVWQLEPDLSTAEAMALRVGGFYERRKQQTLHGVRVSRPGAAFVAERLAERLSGAMVVGVGPWFDMAFIGRFLDRHGLAAAWDHRLVCAKLLAAGCLMGQGARVEFPLSTSEVVGAVCPDFHRSDVHDALMDARMARALFDWAHGGSIDTQWWGPDLSAASTDQED
jgi:hypothetical protein